MKNIFRKEVLIGLIVIIAMAVLFVGIEFLKGVNVFKAANYYYVSFDNVAGLAKSAPVTINGFKVGLVRDISIDYNDPDKVQVELSLDRDLRLPFGSKAVLSSDLLGTASIVLDLEAGENYYEVGDKLEGVVPKGMMDNVSDELLPSLSGVFPKVDTLLTSINAILGSPSVSASVARLDAITLNLERSTKQLNALVANLSPITSDIKTITGNFSVASGEISNSLQNMQLDSIANNLQTLSANLCQLSEQLNSPNSSLGLLTNDSALYNNLNSTVADLDSLFIDIKRNPKRYINIKLL